MTQLALNAKRTYEVEDDPKYGDVPALTAVIIYEGSAVGLSSGFGRQLVAADVFAGMAIAKCDMTGLASGLRNIRVRRRGVMIVDVLTASAVTNVNSTVYASDGNVFTLASTGNSTVGKVLRWISGTQCAVYFEGTADRSI